MTTVSDWSRAFNILWNNIMSDAAPGISDYEKGVFLTQAQIAIVKDYFSAKANTLGEGFDDSSRRQGDFIKLIKSCPGSNSGSGSGVPPMIPDDLMFILNEEAERDGKPASVVALSWLEYARLMKKPYKKPPKGVVWRLITDNDIKLIPEDAESSYVMRYVAKPTPIVLTGTNISATDVVDCDLPEHLHDEILQRAVMLAKIAWTGTTEPQGKNIQ